MPRARASPLPRQRDCVWARVLEPGPSCRDLEAVLSAAESGACRRLLDAATGAHRPVCRGGLLETRATPLRSPAALRRSQRA